MEIKLTGYVVKGIIQNEEILFGQNIRGQNWQYSLDGSSDNDRVSPKVYPDIKGAEKAIDYMKRTWMCDMTFEILPVEVVYYIKEK